jgi:hypothetical protein
MNPKRPRGLDWQRIDDMRQPDGVLIERWRSGPILVGSSLQDCEAPDGNGTTQQWLVSISNSGKRPKPHHVRRVLRAFDMVGAESDAHHPGVAVHYWLVCDPERRVACQCKTDEDVIVEPDGYAWTNPKPDTGEACRGCEFQAMYGKPCPLHSAPTVTP